MTDPMATNARDRRVEALAAEVAETQDRKVPQILLTLEAILDGVDGSKEAPRVRQAIWKYDLIPVLLLVLRQDYGLAPGGWKTAAKLSTVLSRVCSGLEVPAPGRKDYLDKYLPEAVDNMYIVARRVQARHAQIPANMAIARGKKQLLSDFKEVLDALIILFTGHDHLTMKVIQSPWLLQLLINDDVETVVSVMNFVLCIVRTSSGILGKIPNKVLRNIMDELIYKLSVNTDPTIGGCALKCVLRLCEYHKPLVEFLCTRYRGLRPLLNKWTGKGFGRELKELLMLLDAGNSQRAEMERFHRAATTIQAVWKGLLTRRRLEKANKAFGKLQRTYRGRRVNLEKQKEEDKVQKELEHQLLLNRQRIMREFHEKRLHTIEILPPEMLQMYMEKEQKDAAVTLQRTWRGHRERLRRPERIDSATQFKAAVLIQQTVRRWLERLDKRRKDVARFQKPPGLTDDRRVELQQVVLERRESNSPKPRNREEQEDLHKTAQEMLARYYMSTKVTRRKHQHREALLARLETDSELLMYAPPLKDVTEKDADMYSSRSVPVAACAQLSHKEELRLLRQPWWRKLGDQYQDQQYEEDQELLF